MSTAAHSADVVRNLVEILEARRFKGKRGLMLDVVSAEITRRTGGAFHVSVDALRAILNRGRPMVISEVIGICLAMDLHPYDLWAGELPDDPKTEPAPTRRRRK